MAANTQAPDRPRRGVGDRGPGEWARSCLTAGPPSHSGGGGANRCVGSCSPPPGVRGSASPCVAVPVSRPVGGILFPGSLRSSGSVTIHLCGLPEGCHGLPWRTGRPCPLLGLAPGGGCPAAGVAPDAGALLPHRFTLACAARGPPSAVCSLLPCTVRSLRPGSRQHLALRSPDLPRSGKVPERGHPGGSPAPRVCHTASRATGSERCRRVAPPPRVCTPIGQKSSAERSSCQCPARRTASAQRSRSVLRSESVREGSSTSAGDQAAATSSQPAHAPVASPAR